MELELGLKISKSIDDFTSSADLLIAKDRSGPVFVSRETDSMFILTAHLKGYKRKFVKIEINEDGTRIAVSSEKPVQEMVMVGWKMYKKEREMRGFRKAFRIPDGVILDKIKARFNEEESTLTISIPKYVKGVRGIGVEEVKEEQVVENLPGSSEEREDQEAESRKLEERGFGDREDDIGTVESTGIVSDQVVEEKGIRIPPPLDEKDQVVEGNDGIVSDQVVEERGIPIPPPLDEKDQVEDQVVEANDGNVTDQVVEERGIPIPPPLDEKDQVVEANDASAIPRVESKIEGEESERQESPQVVEERGIPFPPSLDEKDQVVEANDASEIPRVESKIEGEESERQESPRGFMEPKEDRSDHQIDKIETFSPEKEDQEVRGREEIEKRENGIIEEKEDEDGGLEKLAEEVHRGEPPLGREKEKSLDEEATRASQPPERRSALCVPIMAGSAFLVSIIVLVIHWIRTKNPPSRNKN